MPNMVQQDNTLYCEGCLENPAIVYCHTDDLIYCDECHAITDSCVEMLGDFHDFSGNVQYYKEKYGHIPGEPSDVRAWKPEATLT